MAFVIGDEERVSRPVAYVSMAAVRHNVGVIRAAVGEGVRICAVLKADAYGHGAAHIARELAGSGARRVPLVDAVAVATFEEAEGLGRMAVPVYVLRPVDAMEIGSSRGRIEEAIRLGWVMAVNSVAAARDLARVAQGMRVPALVQIGVDTGMARAGVAVERFDELVGTVTSLAALRLVSLSTHFVASEDVGCAMTGEQLATFRRVTDPVVAVVPGVVRHVANSGGVFMHGEEMRLDMVRPGKAVYGIDPGGMEGKWGSGEIGKWGAGEGERRLKPILRWVAPLMMVRELKKGETVGYGATFTAPAAMKLGLVGVGFADGYMRCLSNRGVMVVRGREVPVVGRVSMDYVTLDVTGVPEAHEGDVVTVISDEAGSGASVYGVAKIAGTIPSEVLCGIGARIERVAVGSQVPGVMELGPRVGRERGKRVRAAG